MENIQFSTDKSKLDMEMIINFLHKDSYWANDRPASVIKKSIEHSRCVGMFQNGRQIGFARIVSDFTTAYYLADLFILPELQNRGLGHRLMEYIVNMDDLKGLRGMLTTKTAHKFYKQFGFSDDNDIVTKRMMVRPGVKK